MEWSEEAFTKGWGTPRNRRVLWGSHASGYQIVVGSIAGHSVRINISYVTVSGRIVLFWHPDSRVVDIELCEKWLQRHVPAFDQRQANADNFHHVLDYLGASR